jgi:AcrR family transcriptional regulator
MERREIRGCSAADKSPDCVALHPGHLLKAENPCYDSKMMNQTPLSGEEMSDLRRRLLGGPPFMEMARAFINHAVKPDGADDARFQEYFRAILEAVTEETAAEVAALAESPIERTFLNSLLLTFIKGDGLGLLVHRTYSDAVAEVADFRKVLASVKDFATWFRDEKPANSIEEFFDSEVARGAMPPAERELTAYLYYRYGLLSLENSYHMTLQPRFPSVKINGKAIRPDIYFWIPNKPQVNIIVECDGFSYHSSKETFISDRQRDRALKALGFDVWRFSGSEIINDPVYTPYELAEYLWARAEAHEAH